MNYKMNVGAGDNFHTVAEKALKLSEKMDTIVEFEFNGINCLVSKITNLEWLYRDYCNAWTMDWKTVGCNCVANYDKDTQKELDNRTAAKNKKMEQQAKESAKQEKKERDEFNKSIQGIVFEVVNMEEYQSWKDKNTDGYGSCCFEYAEGWAKLMQREITNGKTIKECAEDTSHKLGFLGITGFMYGMAVNILSKCWKHGEELRRWHNKEYNHEGDGVVNPSVLTIGTKD